jgi:tRNA nucleotidyltransferase (CCA-adding enzyme)
LDVIEAPAIRGIVDGKLLSKTLGVKPGIWMGPALNVCMEWQLRNPGTTDTAAAIDEVRKRKEELKIPMK